MSTSKPQPRILVPENRRERLGSWKEIAAYLNRDERTVRRWEAEGLPVHRKLHKKQASVYAYKGEIDAWWNDGRQHLDQAEQVDSLSIAVPRTYRRRGNILAAALVVAIALLVGLSSSRVRERLFGRRSPPRIQSLAVLPLVNLSGNPDQEYFADGMTDQLITDLAKISALKVISRTSVMQYKGARKPLPQIAQELGVDAVVEGSVQRSGDRVRISAQLIDARADQHLWARSYERDLLDVLTLQDDVAQAIANELKLTLTSHEQLRLASSRPVDPEAYEAYLKGRYYSSKRT